jgi:hypothetical protein
MTQAVEELWSVAQGAPHVDAQRLARAVEDAVVDNDLDYRTRLLMRDSLRALEAHWGADRFKKWLHHSPRRKDIELACDPAFFDASEDRGFRSLERRVMDVVRPEQIQGLLRELSEHITKPTRIVIGGSGALILAGQLSRNTDDVDVVNEVPAELRAKPQLLDDLVDIHKLRLAHFQSHYLPDKWERRIRSVGVFGDLQVFAVDAHDVFVGKLFSVRKKDRMDLHALVSKLDREIIRRRVQECTAGLRSDERLLDAAKQNWYVLFGDQLPDLTS